MENFELRFTLDKFNWNDILDENKQTLLFDGNFDDESIVRSSLGTPVLAQRLQLRPTAWSDAPALQWELYGCPVGA